jgi:hypothetical protein
MNIYIGEEKFGIESKEVILNYKNLTALPESIGNLTKLETLDFANNKLTALPESIGNLTNLKILDLSMNDLTALPESIGNLTKLETLDFANNKLTALPESIGNLTNLETLDLYMNKLTKLPESIGKLTNLETLNLYGNGLLALPESIGNLTNLKTLDLYGNELIKLPESIGNLTNLKTLDLYANELTELPESIGNLMKSKMTIDVGYNKLIYIPKIPLEYFHCLDNVSSNYKTLKTLPIGYIDWYINNTDKTTHQYKEFLEKINNDEIIEDVISDVKIAIAPEVRNEYPLIVSQINESNKRIPYGDEKITIGDLPPELRGTVFSYLQKKKRKVVKEERKKQRKKKRMVVKEQRKTEVNTIRNIPKEILLRVLTKHRKNMYLRKLRHVKSRRIIYEILI